MWQSNSIGSRKNSVSDPFSELFQPFIDMRVISGFDFMIRFELLSIFAASQSLSIPYAIRKNWKRFYPEIPSAVETELFAEMVRYIESYRLGMKLLSEGRTINNRSIRENAIVPMALLLAINESNGQVDPDEVCAKAFKLLAKIESDPHKLKTRLKDALMRLSCPLNSQTTLMPETVKTLQKNLPMLRRLFDSLYRTLERRSIPDRRDTVSNPNPVSESAGHAPLSPEVSAAPPPAPVSNVRTVLPVAPQPVQTEAVKETGVVSDSADVKATRQEKKNLTRHVSRYDSSYTQNCSPLLFSRVVCLLELCLIKKQEGEVATGETGRIASGNEGLEPLFKAYWSDIFSEPYSPELYRQLFLIIRGNRFLDSISFLFRYPLEDLRSDKILRAIIIARSVNCALSRIPRRTTINTLIEESLSLYEKFNVVSVGAEEEDTVSYIKRFQTLDGQLDERVLTLFRTHKEIIDRSIQKTQEGLTKNRTRNRYVEAVAREED